MYFFHILTKFLLMLIYNNYGDNMKVKMFDESHEKDLEVAINNFLNTINSDIIDIKYSVAISVFGEEQVYCFTAMVIYSD